MDSAEKQRILAAYERAVLVAGLANRGFYVIGEVWRDRVCGCLTHLDEPAALDAFSDDGQPRPGRRDSDPAPGSTDPTPRRVTGPPPAERRGARAVDEHSALLQSNPYENPRTRRPGLSLRSAD